MTIEKGRSWGEPATDVAAAPTAANDAALASMAAETLARDEHLVARIDSGDLLATLGVTEGRSDAELIAYPMDLGMAWLDEPAGDANGDGGLAFVAHLTAQPPDRLGSLLRAGPNIALSVMNAAWFGEFRLGPRAHPNDGLLDIVSGQIPFRNRWEAARRARSGSHLPHPALTVIRRNAWQTDFGKVMPVWLDGINRGRARRLRVEVIPDAFTVVA